MKAPTSLVRAPTVADVVRFMAIIRHLDHGQRYPYSPPPSTGKADWCGDCRNGNHAHALATVPPYVICRCLNCPTLVVEAS